MSQLRLLLIEDDVVDRAAAKRALTSAAIAATVIEVDEPDAAIAVLQNEHIDCVLLDYRLPKGDGLELLKRARQLGIRVPFIVLTGQGDEQLAVEMMQAGASDYLPKQALTADRLERSLRHSLAIFRAEEERVLLLAREKAAREEAQTANRAKDEFLAMLSHELRTPLNAILGWARLLAGGTLTEANAARAVETIERNARAQARLIEDLLDISRVATGKIELELAPMDPAMLVESVVDSFRPTAASKGLTITCDCRPESGTVMADAARLHQVLGNLITNAIKFTPSGGTVAVRLEVARGRALISVRDSGIGLDPAFLPHAFERFRQADTGSARQHGGLGLGLAIVQHLSRLHGGDVVAESEGLNRGATFTVSLPLLPVNTSAPSASDNLDTQMPSLAGIHVLAVDDDPEATGLIETVLQGQGARVTVARSVGDALRAIEAEVPHVLITDIAMPEEDGYSLIRAVRSSPAQAIRELPAAAITAYATANDRARAMISGFQSHLPKPVEPNELTALIATLAGRRTAAGG